MRKQAILFVLAAAQVIVADGHAQAFHETLGPGHGTLIDGGGRECGELLMYTDGDYYDAAYAWQCDGVVPPYYGAFAEKYYGEYEVCSIVLDLTQMGGFDGQPLDAYMWAGGHGGPPGAVVYMEPNVAIDFPAYWPSFSRHTVELSNPICTEDIWWVGYWGNWPGEDYGWAIGASYHTALPGSPHTCIAPNMGFPEGWQHVEVVWGFTEALGIGAEVNPCPTPVKSLTWGKIKKLFL